jgi:hypothetical protein
MSRTPSNARPSDWLRSLGYNQTRLRATCTTLGSLAVEAKKLEEVALAHDPPYRRSQIQAALAHMRKRPAFRKEQKQIVEAPRPVKRLTGKEETDPELQVAVDALIDAAIEVVRISVSKAATLQHYRAALLDLQKLEVR